MASTTAADEAISPALTPLEIALRLPASPHTTIHMHLTLLGTTILLFLTSTSTDALSDSSAGGLSALGSFVYAMPDVRFEFTAWRPFHV